MQRSRQMVFVSGVPGAGQTTLAVPLAAELRFALVCKDKLKETLHGALGSPAPDLAWSRKLGAAAMELLWALAADAPSLVIEGNFRPHDLYQAAETLRSGGAGGQGLLPVRPGACRTTL